MAIAVQPQFISIGVNRVVNALDWGTNELVAYGGHNTLVIYDPKVEAADHRRMPLSR
jgi:hypothetical protein